MKIPRHLGGSLRGPALIIEVWCLDSICLLGISIIQFAYLNNRLTLQEIVFDMKFYFSYLFLEVFLKTYKKAYHKKKSLIYVLASTFQSNRQIANSANLPQ